MTATLANKDVAVDITGWFDFTAPTRLWLEQIAPPTAPSYFPGRTEDIYEEFTATAANENGTTWALGSAQTTFGPRTITPTFYFGKGFGDLPDSTGWIRAFALTGQVGYSIPTSSSMTSFDPDSGMITVTPNPRFLVYGTSLQYSMPYLKSNIVDLQLPDFINHLIPIVEAQFTTPVANNFGMPWVTTGTVNPGVIWVGAYFQVGLEAIVPINRASGTGVGVLAQLHLYLDDMFPTTIGKPLFGTAAPPQKPFP